MARLVIATLLLTLACMALAGPTRAEVVHASSDQTVDGDELLDHGYDFRIQAPGPGWTLMPEAEIRAMAPDAVAGVLGPGPVFGMIIVEKAPALDVHLFAETVHDALELEQVEELGQEDTLFRGEAAVRFRLRGLQQGFLCQVDYTVFVHQGHAYQLVLFGAPDAMADTEAVHAWRASFSFLGGPVRGRATVRAVPDFRGVGWRVRDGRFASAAYGIAVDPEEPWHVAVGTELTQMNADAEVGLVASDPEAFIVLIPEQAAGVDREPFAAMLLQQTLDGLTGTRLAEDRVMTVDGRELTFAVIDVTWPFPSEMMHAVHFEGDTCIQVLGWFYPTEREAALPELQRGFEMIRLLTVTERAALKKDLRSSPEPAQEIGLGWSLRDGTYRDFLYGFGWRAPGADLWRVRAGQDARAANPDAQLYIEEPSYGLFGVVIGEEALGRNGAAFHQEVLDHMGGTARARPRKVRVSGGKGLTTRMDLTYDELALGYRITTFVVDGRGLQLVLWGLPANVDAATDAIEAAIDGVTLYPDGLEPVQVERDRYTDLRCGWSLALPDRTWSCTEVGDQRMAALGTQVTCTDGEAEAMVLAVQAAHVGQDEEWMQGYAEQLFAQLAATTASGQVQHEEGTLGGQPSRLLHMGGAADGLTFEHTVHRQTLYGLLLMGAPAHAADLRALRDGFELLP